MKSDKLKFYFFYESIAGRKYYTGNEISKEIKKCINGDTTYESAQKRIRYLIELEKKMYTFEQRFSLLEKDIYDYLKSDKKLNDHIDNQIIDYKRNTINLNNKIHELQYALKTKEDKITRMKNWTSTQLGAAILACKTFSGLLHLPSKLYSIYKESKNRDNTTTKRVSKDGCITNLRHIL